MRNQHTQARQQHDPHANYGFMATVCVGEVRAIRGSSRFALVIFVREASAQRVEDVRIVPLFLLSGGVPTERDAVIHFDGNEFIAEAWNARRIVSALLQPPIGRVDPGAVHAVRATELVGIVPHVDLAPHAAFRRAGPSDAKEQAAAVAFQLHELSTWNEIEQAALALDEPSRLHPAIVYPRKDYHVHSRPRVVDFAIPISHRSYKLRVGDCTMTVSMSRTRTRDESDTSATPKGHQGTPIPCWHSASETAGFEEAVVTQGIVSAA